MSESIVPVADRASKDGVKPEGSSHPPAGGNPDRPHPGRPLPEDESIRLPRPGREAAGLALSGLVHPLLAASLLVAYLLFSVHIALGAASGGVFQIAYGGIGGTELRLMLAALNLALLQWPSVELLGRSVRVLDVVALAGTLGLLAMLAGVGFRTGRALERADSALLRPAAAHHS